MYSNNFDEAIEDAKDLRKEYPQSKERPISKKYNRTSASDRRIESSKIEERFRNDSSKKRIEEHERSVKDIIGQSNVPDRIDEEQERDVKNSIPTSTIEQESRKTNMEKNQVKIEKLEMKMQSEHKRPETKEQKAKPKPAVVSKKQIKKLLESKEREKASKQIQKRAKLQTQVVQPEEHVRQPKPQKPIPSHIIASKKRKPKSKGKKEMKEEEEAKPKTASTSDSGSSINSQKNKSHLEDILVNSESKEKGFIIRMNIAQKNLKK